MIFLPFYVHVNLINGHANVTESNNALANSIGNCTRELNQAYP